MGNEFYFRYLNFLKKYGLYEEQAFQYIKDNAVGFDYREESARDFVGCYCIYKNDILSKVQICVPYIVDDKTVMINIHEYVHAFLLYSKLGKRYRMGLAEEVLPVWFEKLYILEYPTQGLIAYENYLNCSITNKDIKYKIALDLQDELMNIYQMGMDVRKLDKKVRRLTKRKHKNFKKE